MVVDELAGETPEVTPEVAPDNNQQEQVAQQAQASPQEAPAPVVPDDNGKNLFDALSLNPKYKEAIGNDVKDFKARIADRETSDGLYNALKMNKKYAEILPSTAKEFYDFNNEGAAKSGVQKAADKDNDNASFLDRTIGFSKYIANSFKHGVADVIHSGVQIGEKATSSSAALLMGLTDDEIDKAKGGLVAGVDKLNKDTDLSGDRHALNGAGGVTAFFGGLSEFAPQLFDPTHASTFLYGYNKGKEAINGSEIGKGLSPNQKEGYALVYGGVQAGLMASGFPKVIKNSKFLSSYVEQAVIGVMEKVGWKQAGAKVGTDLLAKETSGAVAKILSTIKQKGVNGLASLKDRAISAPGKVLDALPHSVGSMMALQAGTEGVNAITNAITGKDVFHQDLKGIAERLSENAAQGAIFAAGSAFSGAGMRENAHPVTQAEVDHQSANAMTPEALEKHQAEIRGAVHNNSIHPIDGALLLERSSKINDISKTLPDHYTPGERTKSAVAIHEKNLATTEVESAKAKSQNIAPEFKNEAGNTPEVDLLQHKLDSKADEVHEVINGGKYKYFQDEHGKYFKQFEANPPIEIAKGRYDYEKVNSNESKVTKAAPEQNETTGKFEPYVAPLLTDEGSKVGEVKEGIKHKETVKAERQVTQAEKDAKEKGKADYQKRQGQDPSKKKVDNEATKVDKEPSEAKSDDSGSSDPQPKELTKGDKITYKDPKSGKERTGQVIQRNAKEGAPTEYNVRDKDGNKSTINPEHISKANGKDYSEPNIPEKANEKGSGPIIASINTADPGKVLTPEEIAENKAINEAEKKDYAKRVRAAMPRKQRLAFDRAEKEAETEASLKNAEALRKKAEGSVKPSPVVDTDKEPIVAKRPSNARTGAEKDKKIEAAVKKAKGRTTAKDNANIELIDKEHMANKGLKGLGATLVQARMKLRKGYAEPAGHFMKHALTNIFDGLSKKKEHYINDENGELSHMSKKEILGSVISARRIIAIDKYHADTFKSLAESDKTINKLKKQYEADPTPEKQEALVAEMKDQLENLNRLKDNGVLTIDKNGVYELGQFKHEHGQDTQSSKFFLDYLKDNLPNLHADIMERADKYFDYRKTLVDYMHDQGLVTNSSAGALKAYDYAGRQFLDKILTKEITTEPNSKTGDGGLIKSLKQGSHDEMLYNYDQGIIHDTNKAFRAGFENKASLSLADFINGDKDKALSQGFYTAPKGHNAPDMSGSIRVFKNGVESKIIAPIEFVESWKGLSQWLAPELAAGISKWSGANILKAAATGHNPLFALFQLPMDSAHVLLHTDVYNPFLPWATAKYLKDWTFSLPSVVARNGVWERAMKAGSFSDLLYQEGGLMETHNGGTHIFKNAVVDGTIGNVLKASSWLNGTSEMSTRTAVFARVEKNLIKEYKAKNGQEPVGKAADEIQAHAAYASRSTVDFSQGGRTTKDLNSAIPYLNSAIQAGRVSLNYAKAHPLKYGAKVLQFGAGLAGIAAYNMGHFETDEKKKLAIQTAYRAIPSYIRQNGVIIRLPSEWTDGKVRFMKLNLPQEMRYITSATEQISAHMVMGDPVDKGAIASAAWQAFPFNPMELPARIPAANAGMQYQTNYNAFTNSKIYKGNEALTPDWQEGQGNDRVSKIYQLLGQATKGLGSNGEGISPIRAQAVVNSFIGNPDNNPLFAIPNRAVETMMHGIAGGAPEAGKYLGESDKSFGFIHRLMVPEAQNGSFSQLSSTNHAAMDDYSAKLSSTSEVTRIYSEIGKTGGPITRIAADKQAASTLEALVNSKQITETEAAHIAMVARTKGLSNHEGANYMQIAAFSGNMKMKAFMLFNQLKDKSQADKTLELKKMGNMGILPGKAWKVYLDQLNKGVSFDKLVSDKDKHSKGSLDRVYRKFTKEDQQLDQAEPQQQENQFDHGSINVNGKAQSW